METLAAHIQENYNIEPENLKLSLVGRSAGAHLAMFYAYTREFDEFIVPKYVNTEKSPIEITHIVDDVGPVDATDQDILDKWGSKSISFAGGSATIPYVQITLSLSAFNISGMPMALCLLSHLAALNDVLQRDDDRGAIARMVNASPITYADNACPTLMRYGGADNMVPLSHGVMLSEKLDSAGVPNSAHYYAGGHYLGDPPPGDQNQASSDAGVHQEFLDDFTDYFWWYMQQPLKLSIT